MFPAKDHERRASAARLRREALDADDARLIGRVARGDGSALESLFHRYGPRVQRFLQRLTRRSPVARGPLLETCPPPSGPVDR